MSKTKEALLREQDNLMQYYIGFYKWLERYQVEQCIEDRDQREKEYSSIISSKPTNNQSYKPTKGLELWKLQDII